MAKPQKIKGKDPVIGKKRKLICYDDSLYPIESNHLG
jgi:hypothetical protein